MKVIPVSCERPLNRCELAAPILARGNILATNQIASRTTKPFENNNKRSQGRLGEGGPVNFNVLKHEKSEHLSHQTFVTSQVFSLGLS